MLQPFPARYKFLLMLLVLTPPVTARTLAKFHDASMIPANCDAHIEAHIHHPPTMAAPMARVGVCCSPHQHCHLHPQGILMERLPLPSIVAVRALVCLLWVAVQLLDLDLPELVRMGQLESPREC